MEIYKIFEPYGVMNDGQIKLIKIDEQLNEFTQDPLIEIVDIQYQASIGNGDIYHTALVRYIEHPAPKVYTDEELKVMREVEEIFR